MKSPLNLDVEKTEKNEGVKWVVNPVTCLFNQHILIQKVFLTLLLPSPSLSTPRSSGTVGASLGRARARSEKKSDDRQNKTKQHQTPEEERRDTHYFTRVSHLPVSSQISKSALSCVFLYLSSKEKKGQTEEREGKCGRTEGLVGYDLVGLATEPKKVDE